MTRVGARKTVWLGVIVLFFQIALPAQTANTLLAGKLTETDRVKTIDLYINQRYLDGQFITLSSNILEDGSFAFAVPLVEPQLVTLSYGRNLLPLYLEPNDTLFLLTNSSLSTDGLKLEGRSGANNQYLHRYFTDNSINLDPFQQTQFKIAGRWFAFGPQMSDWIQSLDPVTFTKRIGLRKEEALQALDFYAADQPKQLSSQFRDFLATEILYDWAYHSLQYGQINRQRYQLDQSYFEFTDQIPFNSLQLGSFWYREYLLSYLVYRMVLSGTATAAFDPLYRLGTELFQQETQGYLQSELITLYLEKDLPNVLPKYNDFIRNNPYREFDQKVSAALFQALKSAEGVAAPDFTLNDVNEQPFKLSEHRDKVIYLNFWASWCKPCLAKSPELNDLYRKWSPEGVEFVHVSLDRNTADWKQAIQAHQIKGSHVRVQEAIDDDMLRQYKVQAIPQFFLIDKSGRFGPKPKSIQMDEIAIVLESLLKSE